MENVIKFPQTSDTDKQFLELERQQQIIQEQRQIIDKINQEKKNV